MGLLSPLYRMIVRGSALVGVVSYDRLPAEVQDEVFDLAADLVKAEQDVSGFPPATREKFIRRFIRNHGLESHPYSRTVYWIAGHLRKEGGGLL
jgi:hypothetical protein